MARTNLIYTNTERIWLKHDGFDRLHTYLNQLTDHVYRISASVPVYTDKDDHRRVRELSTGMVVVPGEIVNHSLIGTTSIFCWFCDYVPSPFGDLVRAKSGNFERPVRIREDYIEEKMCQMGNRALRAGVHRRRWHLNVEHLFRKGAPTLDFHYSITELGRVGDEDNPGLHNLLKNLNIERMSHQNHPYRGFDIGLKPQQHWDPAVGRWRGVGYRQRGIGIFTFTSDKPTYLE